jgi:hypothetical protein
LRAGLLREAVPQVAPALLPQVVLRSLVLRSGGLRRVRSGSLRSVCGCLPGPVRPGLRRVRPGLRCLRAGLLREAVPQVAPALLPQVLLRNIVLRSGGLRCVRPGGLRSVCGCLPGPLRPGLLLPRLLREMTRGVP